MAASRNAGSQRTKGSFGLLALGCADPWEVAIDEATSGAARWFAQIDGPSVSFYFEIPSVDIVDKMLGFLESRPVGAEQPAPNSAGDNDSLALGKDRKTLVSLVRDDEYPARFFLVVGQRESPIVRFVFADTEALKLVEVLRQVKQDLQDED